MAISVTSNGDTIAAELGRMSARTTRRMNEAVREAGTDLRDEWRENATETAGAHGKHYPKAIEAHSGWLQSEIYPNESAQQGAMSFEFGSRNQPPHLDGQRALDALAPRIARRFEQIVTFD